MGEWQYTSMNSWPWKQMEVHGQHHALATLPPGNKFRVTIRWKTGKGTDLDWNNCRRWISLVLPWIKSQLLRSQACSLVTVLTEISWVVSANKCYLHNFEVPHPCCGSQYIYFIEYNVMIKWARKYLLHKMSNVLPLIYNNSSRHRIAWIHVLGLVNASWSVQ
jgi:hypothetical protein